jgi:hypothetical protein
VAARLPPTLKRGSSGTSQRRVAFGKTPRSSIRRTPQQFSRRGTLRRRVLESRVEKGASRLDKPFFSRASPTPCPGAKSVVKSP